MPAAPHRPRHLLSPVSPLYKPKAGFAFATLNQNLFSYSQSHQGVRNKSVSYQLLIKLLMASRLDKKILEAVLAGNLRQLKKLGKDMAAEKGVSETLASVKNSEGRGLLHIAAQKRRTNICKYLLEELNFHVDEKDGEGFSPLILAIMEGHLSTVECLIENGADPNAPHVDTLTPLHFACGPGSGNTKMIHLLISKGADVNAPSCLGTPLQAAATCCKPEVFRALLDHGATPNPANLILTPLELSLRHSLECTKLLIQAGANPNGNCSGKRPLAYAAIGGDVELMKCLLQAGADPNITDDVGLKPIELAAQSGKYREVEILYPITSPIAAYREWSITGIMKHAHSEEVLHQTELRVKENHLRAMADGFNALERGDYARAIFSASEVIAKDDTNADALLMRSLCYVWFDEGESALSDAMACIKLRPDWPVAYFRAGVALTVLKRFDDAADTFLLGLKLDPGNKVLRDAFREAVEAKLNSVHI